MTDRSLRLELVSRRVLTPEISEFVLALPDRATLPPVAPGAHLALTTPAGARRRYSIVNADAARERYVLAIKREPASRGGSASMHDALRPGDTLSADPPGNGFALSDTGAHLLIAGGIGITPILPMARHLAAGGRAFRLIYCTRSPGEAAYLDEIRTAFGNAATIHHDGGEPDRAFDFWDLFATPSDVHVRCCGPAALMEEVRAVSGHWPERRVRFEEFRPVEALRPGDRAFRVTLRRSGQTLRVAAGQTLLEALRGAGIDCPSSCETGICGTCRCTLLGGAAEHRDRVLTAGERPHNILPCVSRALDDSLVLDL